jgi:transcriptional regulator with XRE-family HTH domain
MGNTRKGFRKLIHEPGRKAFGKNLDREMRERITEKDRPRKMEELSGIGKSTIKRMIRGEVGSSLDSIYIVAEELGVPAYRLFMSDDERAHLIDTRQLLKTLQEASASDSDATSDKVPQTQKKKRSA